MVSTADGASRGPSRQSRGVDQAAVKPLGGSPARHGIRRAHTDGLTGKHESAGTLPTATQNFVALAKGSITYGGLSSRQSLPLQDARLTNLAGG